MRILAGVARVDITPPLGLPHGTWRLRTGLAQGVHDPLLGQALVISDAEHTVAILTCDLLDVGEGLVAAVRRRVNELTGIPRSAILINAAHNHTAPILQDHLAAYVGATCAGFRAYTNVLVDDLAGAAFAAFKRLQPARVGFGRGRLPALTTNRVWPDRLCDERVSIVRIDTAEGRPLAVAAVFACHGTAIGGQTLDWGADFPAAFRSTVEASLGAECIFLQGCAGDVAPLDFWFGNGNAQPMGFETARRIGVALGETTLASFDAITTENVADVSYRSSHLRLRRRRIAVAPRELDAMEAEIRATPEPEFGPVWPSDLHTTDSAQRFPRYYQLGQIALWRELVGRQHEAVPAELQALRIGGAMFMAMPFEPFTEIGQQIEARSRTDVIVMGYSNGYQGYLPPSDAAHRLAAVPVRDLLDQDEYRWAYGITTSHVEPYEADRLIRASVSLIDKMTAP
jgi:hypothetical protein